MSRRCRVLIVEPYATGSHRQWLRAIRRYSRHDVRCLCLPGRFWKWRMHGGAVTLANRLRAMCEEWRPDVVLTTDMLDLAAFLGLARGVLYGVPTAVYFHENQLTYPDGPVRSDWDASRQRRARRRDRHYGFVNITTALAADIVFWNSAFHRDAFLDAVPRFLGSFPDFRLTGAGEEIADRSSVLPVGIDVATLDRARPPSPASTQRPTPVRLAWNHRWEHDKDPAAFWEAIDRLDGLGLDFRVIVLGESFVGRPPEMEVGLRRHRQRILQLGYAESRAEYARWLWAADIVVSTARHEFFGVSVCEAAACGCIPVLPDRLAYPERFANTLPAASLYRDRDALVDRLAELVADPSTREVPERHPVKHAARKAVLPLDWRRMATVYDERLEELAIGGRMAVGLQGEARAVGYD